MIMLLLAAKLWTITLSSNNLVSINRPKPLIWRLLKNYQMQRQEGNTQPLSDSFWALYTSLSELQVQDQYCFCWCKKSITPPAFPCAYSWAKFRLPHQSHSHMQQGELELPLTWEMSLLHSSLICCWPSLSSAPLLFDDNRGRNAFFSRLNASINDIISYR